MSSSPSRTTQSVRSGGRQPGSWPEISASRWTWTRRRATATAASPVRVAAVGRDALEALAELRGDEIGRELAVAKAAVVEERREEGRVVADAADVEGVQRRAQPLDRFGRSGPWAQSLAIIGS